MIIVGLFQFRRCLLDTLVVCEHLLFHTIDGIALLYTAYLVAGFYIRQSEDLLLLVQNVSSLVLICWLKL